VTARNEDRNPEAVSMYINGHLQSMLTNKGKGAARSMCRSHVFMEGSGSWNRGGWRHQLGQLPLDCHSLGSDHCSSLLTSA
jgi:hypothetical protein